MMSLSMIPEKKKFWHPVNRYIINLLNTYIKIILRRNPEEKNKIVVRKFK